MSPRPATRHLAPELITADRLAQWVRITPRAIRMAAAAGKIPRPKKATIAGMRGEGVSVQVWSEQDRDAIVAWAVRRDGSVWIPPHLKDQLWDQEEEEKGSAPRYAEEFARWVQDAERAAVEVIHGVQSLECAVGKRVLASRGSQIVLASPVRREFFRGVVQALREAPDVLRADAYIMDWENTSPLGEETCTLVPRYADLAWPFSLVFNAREVAETLGSFPVASGLVNPRLVQVADFRMDRPAEIHPALAVDDAEHLAAVRHLRSIIESVSLGEDVARLAEIALAPSVRDRQPAGRPFMAESMEPHTALVLDTRHLSPAELERLESLPRRGQVLFTDALRANLDAKTLRALATSWTPSEYPWELDLGSEVDRHFLESAQDGGEPPFDLIVSLAQHGRHETADLLTDLRTRTATSPTGARLVLAEYQGRWLAAPPRESVAPQSPLVQIELPASRRHKIGPALMRYEDGSIWPLHRGRILAGHMAGYVGGSPTLTLGTMLEALQAHPGQELRGRRNPTVAQVEAMNAVSTTRWSREDLEKIAAMGA